MKTLEPKLNEQRRLLAYRSICLLELGFSLEQTLLLANRNDVVHEAEALLERGWPHEWVADELSDERKR